jgi:hypothetical protein
MINIITVLHFSNVHLNLHDSESVDLNFDFVIYQNTGKINCESIICIKKMFLFEIQLLLQDTLIRKKKKIGTTASSTYTFAINQNFTNLYVI